MEASAGAVVEVGRGSSEAQEPRERLLQLGASALSDAELLSMVLAAGSRAPPSPQLAQWLLESSGGLRALALREPGELADERGLGVGRASLLAAAVELGRRVHRSRDKRPLILSALDACEYVAPMASAPRECFRALALNPRRRLLRDILVTQGSVDRCMVDPRDVFAPAVAVRATFLILVHNHPSGNPEPSELDILLTGRLVNAAAMLGFRVLDHVVVAAEGFVSMACMGLLPEPDPLPCEVAGVARRPWLTPDPESS